MLRGFRRVACLPDIYPAAAEAAGTLPVRYLRARATCFVCPRWAEEKSMSDTKIPVVGLDEVVDVDAFRILTLQAFVGLTEEEVEDNDKTRS